MGILKYFITLTIALYLPSLAMAEEGGSGHYMPGSMSSFIDGVPADPTFILRLNYIHYAGSADINREIPIGGITTLGAEAVSDVYGLTALWAPDWNFSDTWTYAMSMTVPWVDMEVEADVSSSLSSSTTVRRSDQDSGFGDIILMPIMFNQKINKNLNANYRLAIYTPTGDYEVGELANTGKNFWTVEPTAAIMYLGQENGIEASLFFGMDFNTENSDTDYSSGIQAHLDGTLAQHFPLWQGLAGAGLNGFWYQQISDDSGDGATLGSFRARAHGIGPVLSYTHKTLGKDIIAELKWLHEFDNVDRLEGDTIFFKILAKF